MKTLKLNYLLGLLFLATATLFTSCVGEDDYSDISFDATEPEIDGNIVELSTVYSELVQNDFDLYTFEETNNYAVGYVVSSDIGGNFYKQLVIQDKIENPTVGISIQINKAPLFTIFEVGQKVYIKLDGLAIAQDVDNPLNISGDDFGVAELGFNDGGEIGQIGESFFDEHIIRSAEVEALVPTPIQIGSISPSQVNTYVTLENVQFLREYFTFNAQGEIISSASYASEPSDEFDGERILKNCETGSQIILSTSTFSDFKAISLPSGSGSVTGVLTRTFEADKYTFYLNSPEDVDMGGDRCDPEPLCEGPSGGPDVIFEEDFEGITNISQLTGWINVNTEGGTLNWRTGDFSNNTYAQVSGFNSGQSYDAWLVTPEIDLTSSTLEQVSLDLEAAFDNGSGLSVLVTENYTGDVLTTEWQELEGIEIPQGPSSGFGGLGAAGLENISCLENIRFAFRYQGSDPNGVTTRYHVDNVRITGEAN
jgi:hypothetical protein